MSITEMLTFQKKRRKVLYTHFQWHFITHLKYVYTFWVVKDHSVLIEEQYIDIMWAKAKNITFKSI